MGIVSESVLLKDQNVQIRDSIGYSPLKKKFGMRHYRLFSIQALPLLSTCFQKSHLNPVGSQHLDSQC